MQKTVSEFQLLSSKGNSYFFIKFSWLTQSILRAYRPNVGLEHSTSLADALNHSYPLWGFNKHAIQPPFWRDHLHTLSRLSLFSASLISFS